MAACPSTGHPEAARGSARSLEDLAMSAYLSNLEDVCAVYIQERGDAAVFLSGSGAVARSSSLTK